MVPYFLTKTEKIPHATGCGEGYADSFGMMMMMMVMMFLKG